MRIQLIKGDITQIAVDAIVNAANSSLLGGGGVDGAIHRAGGPSILEECKRIRDERGGCPTGQAVHTSAGNLKAKYIIHTVGPIWNGGNSGEPELLKNCYQNALGLAEQLNVKNLAFPNIGTGIYGYPKKEAAIIATSGIKSFYPDVVEEIIFVCFDDEHYRLYQELLKEV